MMTIHHAEISREMVYGRIDDLISQFFKILPLRENASETLPQYISSLLREMLGLQSLMMELHDDGMYLSLLGILQYMLDHPDSDVSVVRSDVFKAIDIIKKLQKKYTGPEMG